MIITLRLPDLHGQRLSSDAIGFWQPTVATLRPCIEQGRRTADLTEQLAVAGSGDFQTLRSQLARAQQVNHSFQLLLRRRQCPHS